MLRMDTRGQCVGQLKTKNIFYAIFLICIGIVEIIYIFLESGKDQLVYHG